MSGSLRRSVLGPWPVSTLTSPAPAQTRRHITRHGGDSKAYSHLPQMWVVLCSGRSDDQVQPAACMSLPSPGFAEGPLGTHWPLFLGCPSLSADSSVPLTCHHGPLQDQPQALHTPLSSPSLLHESALSRLRDPQTCIFIPGLFPGGQSCTPSRALCNHSAPDTQSTTKAASDISTRCNKAPISLPSAKVLLSTSAS